jgi:hypothetical protein
MNARQRTARSGQPVSWIRSQAGQAIVIVAFMIVVLVGGIGLAIDAGVGYVQDHAAERAAAAAALSGVVFMPLNFAQASARAQDEASRNGFRNSPPDTVVTPAAVPTSSNSLRVTISKQVGTFFMRVWGIGTFTVTETAIAILLPPLQLGQPGGQLGSPASKLGTPGNYYFLRSEGWTTNRGEGDAYSPNNLTCAVACDSSDVHQLSAQKGTDFGALGGGFSALPSRGGWNFRVLVPSGVAASIEVYNAGFGVDGNCNGPPTDGCAADQQSSHCDNWQLGAPAAPYCNTAPSNYNLHEHDGSFSRSDFSQYTAMMYTVFRMANEYVRTQDTVLTQMKVIPVDARTRWPWSAGGNGTYRRTDGGTITQTFNGDGSPNRMHIFHDWIDVMQYKEPAPDSDMVQCLPGCGTWRNAANNPWLTAGLYRLRVDTMDSNGNIPSAGCCPGASHKAYAVRVTFYSADADHASFNPGHTLCGTCSLGALGDLALFTPFQNSSNSSFNLPIFQLPGDYRGRRINVDVFDPGDINTQNGQLYLALTDPSMPGPCSDGFPLPCPGQPNPLSGGTVTWQAYNLGCERLPPNACGPGRRLSPEGGTSPFEVLAATPSTRDYDNYWLRFEIPVRTDYDPGLDPNNWWWGLRYKTTNAVTSQDTITITLSLQGSPAHLCAPGPPIAC